jgi:two-component system, chemotaxis family, response regulator Rcp1
MSDQPVPIDILLVEDDPSDVLLTKKALTKAKFFNSLNVAVDGIDALSFLKREGNYADAPRPDLILLDLNMPRMDGREFLAAIKADDDLKRIPVVVLTTSDADQDVIKTYDLQASCYITKPVGLDAFKQVVGTIQDFWLAVVKYPGR